MLNAESLEKMELLFEVYMNEPELLGKKSRRRKSQDSLERIVADYIAGMTDTFALKEYRKFSGKH